MRLFLCNDYALIGQCSIISGATVRTIVRKYYRYPKNLGGFSVGFFGYGAAPLYSSLRGSRFYQVFHKQSQNI